MVTLYLVLDVTRYHVLFTITVGLGGADVVELCQDQDPSVFPVCSSSVTVAVN